MLVSAYLLLSVALFFAMILVQVLANIKHNGLVPLSGARDDLKAPTFFLERAKRANQNMIESLVMFIPLILVAVITERTNGMTALGAALFFWGRLAYAPLYWFGVPWLRSAAWFVGILGLILIFLQILPFTGAA